MITLENKSGGQKIHLADTNNVIVLNNQLKLLGKRGMFYSEIANDIRKKIKRLSK